jgi:hypothetical protein
VNKTQQAAKRKRAQFHTAQQGQHKRTAYGIACDRAKRARREDRKHVPVHMGELGYERTPKALLKSASAGDTFAPSDFRRASR